MRAAVLGSPIAHSLSPVLHRCGYAALGLSDWSYDRFELQADQLPGFVAGLDDSWRGLSLTMPLKEAALQVADEATELAVRAGGANTLVRLPDGRWRADNTDVPGLVAALRPAWNSQFRTAAVLGAGATARSAVLALAEFGVERVVVYARNLARAEALASWSPLPVQVRPLVDWRLGAEPAVLSTLPGGAQQTIPELVEGQTVPEPVEGSEPARGLLFDAVYADWPTPLARAAATAGLTVVGGLDLLVHQAALQFTQFTGREAPIEAMFAAVSSLVEPGFEDAPPSLVEQGFEDAPPSLVEQGPQGRVETEKP